MTKIRISLLPAELKKQSSMMKMWTIIALVMAIVASVLLVGNMLFSFYLKAPAMELESLKNENKSMTDTIGRLSYIQEMFDQIENNNRIIESLMGNNPDWAYVIETAASDLTLYGINISRMEVIAVGETQGCVIAGKTYYVDNITSWIEHAKLQSNLENITLSNISTGTGAGGKLEFHFDAVVGIAKWNKE